MSNGGKVAFDVKSMRHGASTAGQLGLAFRDSADRVAALPQPEGTPPEIAGVLRSVSSSLHLAARSSSSQRSWLRFHAELALLADGPMATLLALLSPPLLAPFDVPKLKFTPLKKPPKNMWGPDWLWHGLGGMKSGAEAFGEGAARSYVFYKTLTDPAFAVNVEALKNDPKRNLLSKWNHDTVEGYKFAWTHPIKYLKLLGEDTIDYNDYRNGDTARGVGRNIFDLGMFLLPAGKLGTASLAAKRGESAREQADNALAAAQTKADKAHEKATERLNDLPDELRSEAVKAANTSGQGVNRELGDEALEEAGK